MISAKFKLERGTSGRFRQWSTGWCDPMKFKTFSLEIVSVSFNYGNEGNGRQKRIIMGGKMNFRRLIHIPDSQMLYSGNRRKTKNNISNRYWCLVYIQYIDAGKYLGLQGRGLTDFKMIVLYSCRRWRQQMITLYLISKSSSHNIINSYNSFECI